MQLFSKYFLHIAAFLCPWIVLFSLLYAESGILTLLAALVSESRLWIVECLDWFFILFTVIMVLPLVYGYVTFIAKAVDGEDAAITDLFSGFRSFSAYKRSICLFWSILWRSAIAFSPALYLGSEFSLYNEGLSVYFSPVSAYGFDLTYTALCILIILVCLVCFICISSLFTGTYLAAKKEDLPISLCFRMASVVNFSQGKQFRKLFISFIPLFALSAVTFGVLFLLYALPLYILAGFYTAKAAIRQDFHYTV